MTGYEPESRRLRRLLRLVIPVVGDLEAFGEKPLDVPGTMQDAKDFNPVLNRPIENEVLLESGDGKDADTLEERVIGFVAGANARDRGQSLKCGINLTQEPDG
jgi:hypothetical protein